MSSEQQKQTYKKLTLVPTESLHLWRNNHSSHIQHDGPNGEEKPANINNNEIEVKAIDKIDKPEVADRVVEQAGKQQYTTYRLMSREQADFLLAAVPKGPMRNRARVLLQYLVGKIRLDGETQRIVYPDLVLGSHLFDMVRWCVLPVNTTLKNRKETAQPPDANQFAQLIKSIGGVPDYSVPRLVRFVEITDKNPMLFAQDNNGRQNRAAVFDEVGQTNATAAMRSTSRESNHRVTGKKKKLRNYVRKRGFHWLQ